MSRVLPYESLDEAVLKELCSTYPDLVDDLMLIIIQHAHLYKHRSDLHELYFPITFIGYDKMINYWSYLCRMFGHYDKGVLGSYIPSENLFYVKVYLTNLIRRIFPPAWDYGDAPILDTLAIDFS